MPEKNEDTNIRVSERTRRKLMMARAKTTRSSKEIVDTLVEQHLDEFIKKHSV